MSRKDDLKELEKEIALLEAKGADIQARYQTYAAEVASSIEAIMKAAGVWEEVNELELDRNRVQQEAQQKLNVLQDDLKDKRKIYQFLRMRESQEKVPPVVAPVASAEAPVAPVEAHVAPEAPTPTGKAPTPATKPSRPKSPKF